MNSRIALLVAVPLILAVVIVLAFLGFFAYPGVLAVMVVLYVIVSLFNRRKFKKQKQEMSGTAGRDSNQTLGR